MKPDKYDEEIEELMSHPDREFNDAIGNHWFDSTPLFQFLTKTGKPVGNCGCPIMIKKGLNFKDGPVKTVKAINRSKLIPCSMHDIIQDRAVLGEFARIQRICDKELGR